jgi:hypothetical protein
MGGIKMGLNFKVDYGFGSLENYMLFVFKPPYFRVGELSMQALLT